MLAEKIVNLVVHEILNDNRIDDINLLFDHKNPFDSKTEFEMLDKYTHIGNLTCTLTFELTVMNDIFCNWSYTDNKGTYECGSSKIRLDMDEEDVADDILSHFIGG